MSTRKYFEEKAEPAAPQTARGKSPLWAQITAGLITIFIVYHFGSCAMDMQTAPQRAAEERAKSQAAAANELDWAIRSALARKELHAGMNADQVRLCWGEPLRVNRTHTAARVSEQWVYQGNYGKPKYAYLDAGVLTSWQD